MVVVDASNMRAIDLYVAKLAFFAKDGKGLRSRDCLRKGKSASKARIPRLSIHGRPKMLWLIDMSEAKRRGIP